MASLAVSTLLPAAPNVTHEDLQRWVRFYRVMTGDSSAGSNRLIQKSVHLAP
jgi:hypothetical protein